MDKNEKNRWLQSLLYTLIIFIILSTYLFLRRGYYNLYIINKVLGSSSVIIAGLTLVIGPLSKKATYLVRFLNIRKHLGLIAFYLALGHIVASLIQYERFAFPAWYLKEWIPILFGILTILIWFYTKTISTNEKIKQMGVDLWKSRLSLMGKLGFLTVFVHLTVMKYPGWIRYFQGQIKQTPELANPSYPPASLFVFFIMVAIIVYRIINDYVIIKWKNKEKTSA